ncbi:hypothetical protein [Pedococcus sp. 5OH_020]|uniref:hypothetical protein n=1 Tax=Pedococcus sp. 5OH_020 TaxID=2989814 RepID=UPI0022E9A6F6|nr:hypothetical protein [Pedococcus sp. 5OH_020]
MTHDNNKHVSSNTQKTPSETPELKIRAQRLAITEGVYAVDWWENKDLNYVLRRGDKISADLPAHGPGGLVLVVLDEEGLAEVVTSIPAGLEVDDVLKFAAEHLQVAARGIHRAEHGAASDVTAAFDAGREYQRRGAAREALDGQQE